MGPIDYLLVEWPGRQPNGEVAPHLIDLVDRGLIRILDLAFIAKAEDGSVAALEIADLGGEVAELRGLRRRLLRAALRRGHRRGRRARSSPAPPPPCSSSRTAGPRRSPRPSAAPAASWSPAAASPSKPSSPRSTRPRPTPKRKETAMPGLLRGVARTAAIAGTATAVSNRVSRRQGERWAAAGRSPAGAAAAAPAPAAPAAGELDDRPAQGARRAEGPGHPHRGGVRGPEGQAARLSS